MISKIAGGTLETNIPLAGKTERMAYWFPDDRGGDAYNADPRIIAKIGDNAEAEVLAILAKRGLL